MPKEPGEADNKPLEVMPLPVVDLDEARPDTTPIEPAAKPDPETPAKPEYAVNDARERIAARLEEQRQEELSQRPDLYDEPVVEAEAEVPAAVEAVKPGDKPAETQPEGETFEVVVDGKAKKLSRAELIAEAQKSLASENRLGDAKSLLAEVRELRAQLGQPQTKVAAVEPEKPGQPDPRPVKTNYEAAQLLDHVEKLQTGDKQEAAEKLADLLNDVAKRSSTSVDDMRGSVQTEISSALVRERESRLAAEAMNRFAENHAVIVKDPTLTNMTLGYVVDEIVADFEKLGMKAEDLAVLRENPAITRDTYLKYRTITQPNGKPAYALRDYDALLTASASRTMSGLEAAAGAMGFSKANAAQPNPSPTVRVERSARKEGIEAQPRPTVTANGRARLSGVKPDPSAEAARREGFAQLRAARAIRH